MRAWRVNDGSMRPFALSIGQITVPLSRKNLPFSAAKCRRGAFNERLSLEVKGGCHVQSASSRRLCCGHEPFARLCRGRVHRRAYGANGQDDRRHEGRGREEGSDHASRHVEGRDEEGQRSRLHGAYAGSPQGHGSVSPSRFRRGKSILRPRLALDGLVPGKRLPRQAVARAPRITDEVMRSLLKQSLDTAKIDADGWHDVGRGPGSAEADFIDWLTIRNQAESVLSDVRRIRAHPLVPASVPIYGYIYDVKNGRLVEVLEATKAGRAA